MRPSSKLAVLTRFTTCMVMVRFIHLNRLRIMRNSFIAIYSKRSPQPTTKNQKHTQNKFMHARTLLFLLYIYTQTRTHTRTHASKQASTHVRTHTERERDRQTDRQRQRQRDRHRQRETETERDREREREREDSLKRRHFKDDLQDVNVFMPCGWRQSEFCKTEMQRTNHRSAWGAMYATNVFKRAK